MLPIGWERVTLAEVTAADGVFVDGDWIESKDQDLHGDVRLVQLADLGDGVFLDKSRRFLTSQRANELKCTYLREGDVLVARMPEPLGRAASILGERQERLLQSTSASFVQGIRPSTHRSSLHSSMRPSSAGASPPCRAAQLENGFRGGTWPA